MINEPANFCDEAHREHIIDKLEAENKKLRDALNSLLSICHFTKDIRRNSIIAKAKLNVQGDGK